MRKMLLLFVILLCQLVTISIGLGLREVGQISIYSVAFTEAGKFNSSSPFGLLASAFGVLSGDALFWIPSISLNDLNNTNIVSLTTAITWPNDPSFVPSNTVAGYETLVAVGSGFLVPTKSTGAVTLIDVSGGYSSYQISQTLSDWFYHRVRFMDVDGDGLKDIITARATKPLFGNGQGELVWYKQPSSNPLGNLPWQVNHIANGPDFLFELLDVNNDGVMEVAAAEYFGQQLSLTYSTTGHFNDPSTVKQVVIDPNIKMGFDVHVLDVNGDGKNDLVATNHEGDGTGSVYAYEVPQNWQDGNWPRHTLASGFPVTEPGFNQASPGAPIAFYPTKDQNGRGWIILAGDGSQCAYELRPLSPAGWDYLLTTIIDTKATVGQPSVADVNEDGYAEVFIPAYDASTLYVYTYAP